MKRLWGILGVLVALLASPAWATTYWVAPVADGGSSTLNGADTLVLSATVGPKTLTWFNANAQPGDICRFKSGDYGTEAISLTTRSGTAANRIRYYGFPQDPQGVRVANVTLGRELDPAYGDYATVRWVKTTSGFTGVQGWKDWGLLPNADSLVAIIGTNCTGLKMNGVDCVFDTLTVTGTVNNTGNGQAQSQAISMYAHYRGNTPPLCELYPLGDYASGNSVKNSTFTFTRGGSGGAWPYGPHDFQMLKLHGARNNVFFNNTFNLTVDHATGWCFGLEGYWAVSNLFQNNTWNFTMNVSPDGTNGVWSLRDRSALNRFLNNTVTVTGASTATNPDRDGATRTGFSFMPTNGGSCAGTTEKNYFGFNTIMVANPQSDAGLFWLYDGTRRDTIEHNLFATSSTRPALTIATQMDGSVFSHNVFYTAGKTAFDASGGSWVPTGQNRLANNVFYSSAGVPTATDALVEYKQGVEADSSGLYFAPAGNPIYAVNNGTGAAAPSGTRNVWGTPAFDDSVYAGGLDTDVTSIYATGSEWGDGFVGTGQNLGVPPTVSIAHPITANTDTVWNTYETMGIWWNATDNVSVSSITIEWMHPDEGMNEWSTIASGEANDGYYAWTLPAFKFSTVAVRVTAIDGDGLTTSATATFRCFAPEIPDRRPTVDDP